MNLKKIGNTLLILLILVNIVLSAWFVINNDVLFHTDIARDFLLINELSQKKVILIGPRSSLPGMFHGPLWTYLSYPAWLLGNGNPVFQGYYWVMLNIILLVINFLIFRKLFNSQVALFSTVIVSFATTEFTRGMFHTYGALILTPVFFYFFIKYTDLGKWKDLLLTIVTIGLITEFQIAFGFPLLILTSIPIFYKILKTKKYFHSLIFLVLILIFSNWLLFDFRHQFIQAKSVINYILHKEPSNYPFDQMLHERVNDFLFSSLYLAHGTYEWFNNILSYFIGIATFLIIKSKNNKHKKYFLYLLFFYAGYWILTLFHPGFVMYHHYIPIIPLIITLFSVIYLYTNKKIFLFLYSLLIIINLIWVYDNIKLSNKFFNKDQTSWKGQWEVAQKVFQDAGNESFGYFIFSPDIVAYPPKYAMIYGQRVYKNITASSFEKKPLTYLIIAPPPADKPYLNDIYWKSDQIKIKSNPIKTFTFPNGYIIEKYRLKEAEINKTPNPFLNKGVELR